MKVMIVKELMTGDVSPVAMFFPTMRIFQVFNGHLGKKQKNVSFYGVYMYVRPKLTFVSFFMFFYAPSPYITIISNAKTF